MSEKKRARRRKDEYTGPGEQEVEKPSKEEYKVAKWMKKNVKTKKTKFLSHNVEYFTSNKAIDALMKSKFVECNEPLFTTRDQIIDFLDVMLEHKFFHRAKKVPVTLDGNATAATASATSTTTTSTTATSTTKTTKKDDKHNEKSSKKDKDEHKKEHNDIDGGDASGTNGVDDATNAALAASSAGDKKEKEKRKRKIRLDMHPEQVFVDGSEAYVWIYDPIPIHYWIYGLIVLLGAIAICLFPLWPPLLRKGVYYLSIVAAGFLLFILILTVLRLIIFTIVWLLTGGKLHLWIFPNLTEDVGFFASFWPLYESKYVTDKEKSKHEKRSKSKSKKKEKESDAEDEIVPDVVPLEPEKIEEVKEHDAEIELRRRKVAENNEVNKTETEEESHSSGGDNSEGAAESDVKCSRTPSESESEISGKDYEIINSSDVQYVN